MEDQPLVEDPRPDDLTRAPSLVLVNTGDGKGKSSAAMGVLMRGVARGWAVAVVQFIKSSDWKVGEEKIGRQLGVDWDVIGDGFSWDSDDLSESEAIAQEAWRVARGRITAGDHQLVILDEITYAMNWGWIDAADVIATLEQRPDHVNVVLTGRDASQALIDVADTVTNMTQVKHAYDSGIAAKRGIDY